MPLQPRYHLLPRDEKEQIFRHHGDSVSTRWNFRTVGYHLTIVILCLANVFTWLAARHVYKTPESIFEKTRSPYAGLEYDTPVAMGEHNPYTTYNETLRDEVWDAINIDVGMVAIPDTYVEEMHLPTAQRFPWDDSKGIYLLNGHHNLHCTRAIYISLMEFRRGEPQSRLWSHVIHCLDSLRQEIICNADDTPRYSTSDDNPESGVGQVRQCRSWDKLEAWAKQYNACYRYVNQTASINDFPQVNRFIYCPEESPYISEVEKYFGHVDW